MDGKKLPNHEVFKTADDKVQTLSNELISVAESALVLCIVKQEHHVKCKNTTY